ncbi:MAG TPA: hypothetical protein DEH78_07090 [Solibacterales bacterium]|nr:hypothetical protein [Bryobacterales bacterium]
MRTTLSLDDDVAAQLEAWRRQADLSLKEAVNTALRRGLSELGRPQTRKPFRTKPADMGRCLAGSLDNVWEVLDEVEDRKAGRG